MVWTARLYRALSETGYMLKMKTTTYGHLALVALWAHSGMQCRPQRIAYRDPYLLQITSCHALQITGVHQRRHHTVSQSMATSMSPSASVLPDDGTLMGGLSGSSAADAA